MNNIARNILSILFGTLTGFCLGAVLIYVSAMAITNDTGIIKTIFFLLIGVFIPAFCSGMVCGYISSNKLYLNLLATSISLLLILLINNDFKDFEISIQGLAVPVMITTFVFIGGEVGILFKKRFDR